MEEYQLWRTGGPCRSLVGTILQICWNVPPTSVHVGGRSGSGRHSSGNGDGGGGGVGDRPWRWLAAAVVVVEEAMAVIFRQKRCAAYAFR